MIIDKKSFFNVNVKDVQAVPEVLIRALENDLATILAQAPADDKMELLLKFHNKVSDNGEAAKKAIEDARQGAGNQVNLADALGKIADGINSLSDKLDNLDKKGSKKK